MNALPTFSYIILNHKWQEFDPYSSTLINDIWERLLNIPASLIFMNLIPNPKA